MIKLASSAALALSVALALSAAPVHANDSRAEFGLGQYSAESFQSADARSSTNHNFGQNVQRQSDFTRRAGTGYTSQPRDFAANSWHRRATGHIDQTRSDSRLRDLVITR